MLPVLLLCYFTGSGVEGKGQVHERAGRAENQKSCAFSCWSSQRPPLTSDDNNEDMYTLPNKQAKQFALCLITI